MRIFKNTISALTVLFLIVGGFFINTGIALAAITINGITIPVTGATPVTTISDNWSYIGDITWSPSPVSGKFEAGTIYTATITIKAIGGYGVSCTVNECIVKGATVTNPAGSAYNSWRVFMGEIIYTPAKVMTVTAVFPATTTDLTSYNAALNSVNQATYTSTSWAAYQTIVNANVMTTANTQVQVNAATLAITTAQGSLITLAAAAAQLVIDQAAALAVDNQITALPTIITLVDQANISAARVAYNALTIDQKVLVTNLNILTSAENTIAILNTPVVIVTPPMPDPIPTCTDGIMNQDETGIDIGGICTPVVVVTPPATDPIPTPTPSTTHKKRVSSGSSASSITLFTAPITETVTTNTSEIGQVLGAEKFNFTLYMRNGSRGNEIKELQRFLNSHNYIIATTGPGSAGNETITFGPKTRAAVINFQIANGLKGDGIVGPATRLILNK